MNKPIRTDCRYSYLLTALTLFLMLILLGSCVQYRHVATPRSKFPANPYFTAEIKPVCKTYFCYSFILTVENKSNTELEIDWNRSYYIDRGASADGIMFKNLAFVDRHSPLPSDLIFAKSKLSKEIFPKILSGYKSSQYSGRWTHERIPNGENGIYLTVYVAGKTYRHKVTVLMDRVKTEKQP